MRQKEFDRFNEIKPLFEIVSSNNAAQFGILNHGGIVYFAGCSNKGAGSVLAKTPRQYSTISDTEKLFTFSRPLEELESLAIFYRDIDLNSYQVVVHYKNAGFYIDGVPAAYRATILCTCALSRKWLDDLSSFLFPKDWFSPGNAPKDEELIVKWTEGA